MIIIQLSHNFLLSLSVAQYCIAAVPNPEFSEDNNQWGTLADPKGDVLRGAFRKYSQAKEKNSLTAIGIPIG
ncbi:hypothetical protein EDB19DRAFT_1730445 [Suillus lakei]|nr:hypothetical protein EDB19DRAFT_1730445 [Suillus lakei]